MVPVERRLKTPDIEGLHDATVVPVRDSRREDRKIAGPEVVSMLVCVCHDGRFGRSRPRSAFSSSIVFPLASSFPQFIPGFSPVLFPHVSSLSSSICVSLSIFILCISPDEGQSNCLKICIQ